MRTGFYWGMTWVVLAAISFIISTATIVTLNSTGQAAGDTPWWIMISVLVVFVAGTSLIGDED